MSKVSSLSSDTPVQKRKRTSKDEENDNLRLYTEGAAPWTIEVDGVSVDTLQDVWSTFLQHGDCCSTSTSTSTSTSHPLCVLTPNLRAYQGFAQLGQESYTRDVSSSSHPTLHPFPATTTTLVALDDLASSKEDAVRRLASVPLDKGIALACRYYRPGTHLTTKQQTSIAKRQSKQETRVYTKLEKEQAKYERLADGICKRIMDPAKGEFVKCGACGARYSRTNLISHFGMYPSSLNQKRDVHVYTCVLCNEPLVTAKEKERLDVLSNHLMTLKEMYRLVTKDFGWLIRVSL